MNTENLISLDKKLFSPGQRVVDFGGGVVMPIGIGGNALPAGGGGGGGSVDFFKCTDVDAEGKTWSGNKAVLTDGVYSFENKVTSGLKYSSVTPAIGKTYTTDALATIGYLWTGDTLNTDKTRFLLMPSRSNNEIKDIAVGAPAPLDLSRRYNVEVDPSDGGMVFTRSDSYIEIPSNQLPDDIYVRDKPFVLHIDVDFSQCTENDYYYFWGNADGSRTDFCYHPTSELNGNGHPGPSYECTQSRQLITLENWKDTDGTWYATTYRNGIKIEQGQVQYYWGREQTNYIGAARTEQFRGLNGKIYMVALIADQPYKGKNFTPPYVIP